VATKQSGLEPSWLQDLGHTALQDQNQWHPWAVGMHCGKWDKLDQRFVDKDVAEWQKRLWACMVAVERQFEHKMWTFLIADMCYFWMLDSLTVCWLIKMHVVLHSTTLYKIYVTNNKLECFLANTRIEFSYRWHVSRVRTGAAVMCCVYSLRFKKSSPILLSW